MPNRSGVEHSGANSHAVDCGPHFEDRIARLVEIPDLSEFRRQSDGVLGERDLVCQPSEVGIGSSRNTLCGGDLGMVKVDEYRTFLSKVPSARFVCAPVFKLHAESSARSSRVAPGYSGTSRGSGGVWP